jgi:serine/threonine-protein kinase SRPK3
LSDCFFDSSVNFSDLQESNVILGLEDKGILEDFERDEWQEPSARKVDGDRVIYQSRQLRLPNDKKYGRPILCDFGEARFGEEYYEGDIQPFLYRAPEVILEMRWNSKVDIWSLGVMVSCL